MSKIEERLKQADEYLNSGKFTWAIDTYEEILAEGGLSNDELMWAYLNRGIANMNEGNRDPRYREEHYRDASWDFQRVMEDNSNPERAAKAKELYEKTQ